MEVRWFKKLALMELYVYKNSFIYLVRTFLRHGLRRRQGLEGEAGEAIKKYFIDPNKHNIDVIK